MDDLDVKIKAYLTGSLDMQLDQNQRRRLVRALTQEAGLGQLNWWQRNVAAVRRFMNTTYEISLAPVAAFFGMLVIAAGIGIAGPVWETQKAAEPSAPIYFQRVVTKPDGGVEIFYIPVGGRGIKS